MANEHYRTLSDIRTRVRNYLDESSASFWSNAQLLTYINDAQTRVWGRIRALNEDYFTVTRSSTDGSLSLLGETYAASSFAIVAGTTTYTLPPDFSEMKLVECITSGYEWVRFIYRDLTHPEFRNLMEVTDNQSPSEFLFDIIQEPPAMRIAPKSDTALDLRITYVKALTDLSSDSDPCIVPRPLDLAVVAYAVSAALMQDRSPDSAAYEARGDKIIAEAFGAHHRQTQDIQVATGYLAEWTGNE